jgi:hypothetical protein
MQPPRAELINMRPFPCAAAEITADDGKSRVQSA